VLTHLRTDAGSTEQANSFPGNICQNAASRATGPAAKQLAWKVIDLGGTPGFSARSMVTSQSAVRRPAAIFAGGEADVGGGGKRVAGSDVGDENFPPAVAVGIGQVRLGQPPALAVMHRSQPG